MEDAEGAQRSRVVIGISGASGVIYGIRLLQMLAARGDVETHLVISSAGAATITSESDCTVKDVEAMADVVHRQSSIGASIASGSFRTAGMVVAPCSIKTLSAIANSYAADLISRAADVTLKEGRPLILMVRESPLHLGQVKLMETVLLAGGIIAPPMPAFYHRPTSIDDLVTESVQRVIGRLGLPDSGAREWQGLGRPLPGEP